MHAIERLVFQYRHAKNDAGRSAIRVSLYHALIDSGMGVSNSGEIEAITRKVKELLKND